MKRFLTLAIAVVCLTGVFANNIRVSSVTLRNQNSSASPKYTEVEFDLSWDNSWASGISWDAAWVFIKYRVGTGSWNHGTLSTTAGHHSITTTNGVAGTVTPTTDGVGAFIYRSSTSNGSNIWQDVRLRWNYGTNSVNDTAGVTIRVFALEMVYVPQGSFTAGDYTNGSESTYGFRNGNNTSQPLSITNENSVYAYLGSTYLTIPASFPKGFNAFYCMKYEMTQQQYIDWFNTLTVTQKNARWIGNNANSSQTSSGTLYTVGTTYRNYIQWRYNTTEDATLQNNVGGDRACNFLNHTDMMAFADWSGLRPMTELEYEKACRGNQTPVVNEYAWGTTSMTNIGTSNALVNDGTSAERTSTANANANFRSDFSTTNTLGRYGPVRAGMFADSASNRVKAGATYYGIMEMSGNMFETVARLPVQSTSNSYYSTSFSNTTHGDGNLNSSGASDVSNFPNPQQTCVRGGAFNNNYSSFDRVSSRYSNYWSDNGYTIGSYGCSNSAYIGYSSTGTSDRRECTGFRAVRTAP